MSLIADFTLMNDTKTERNLPQSYSADVYLAVFDYFEEVLDIDYRDYPAPDGCGQEGALARIALTPELSQTLLIHMQSPDFDLHRAAESLAEGWKLPAEMIAGGFRFLLESLETLNSAEWILYEIC